MFRLLFKYFYCMAWDPYRGPGGKAFSGALEWFSNGSSRRSWHNIQQNVVSLIKMHNLKDIFVMCF